MPVDPVFVGLVRDELEARSDRGELSSRQELQETVGLGAGDLQAALDVLRERGEASEVEPDGYRLVLPDSPATPEPDITLAEAEARAALPTRASNAARPQEPTRLSAGQVIMPRAMVDRLEADVLGGMLKAGIEASPEGETFTFEVTP